MNLHKYVDVMLVCGECCKKDYLWSIQFKGPDNEIFLCEKCLLTMGVLISPLSVLVSTGMNIKNENE